MEMGSDDLLTSLATSIPQEINRPNYTDRQTDRDTFARAGRLAAQLQYGTGTVIGHH